MTPMRSDTFAASLIALAILFVSLPAISCPAGSVLQKGNGWEGCVNISGGASEPLWADRWGAIAIDEASSAFGSSSAEVSKRKAEKYALSMCRKKGGQNCTVTVSYYNQCISYVTGTNWPFIRTDSSIREAESNSLDRCQREDGGCRVIYSACSLQERIQ